MTQPERLTFYVVNEDDHDPKCFDEIDEALAWGNHTENPCEIAHVEAVVTDYDVIFSTPRSAP